MVHPYLRRREGVEAISYPDEAVRGVLERTLGVPIFQEQAMRLAMVAGGFSADEAECLRRAMGAWKRRPDTMQAIGKRLIDGMRHRGYAESFIERCWKQIHGFSEYGFPESHAASFALLVLASAWVKHHHPAAFACSLINSQPMGFYAPAQIVRDAIEHGVEVRPVDVNHSLVGCSLEPCEGSDPALRLGLRMVRGLPRNDADRVCGVAMEHGHIGDLWTLHDAGIGSGSLRRLAAADAFRSAGLDRQSALWEIGLIERGDLPLFPGDRVDERAGGVCILPTIPPLREVLHDYRATGLSLKAHPMSFLRTQLESRGVRTAREVRETVPSGDREACVMVAGLVLVRQRPHSAKGMTFMTVEYETGAANIVLTRQVYGRCRRAVRTAAAVIIRGKIERRGDVVHLKAEWIGGIDVVPESDNDHATLPAARAFH